jgi:hypothetical protein
MICSASQRIKRVLDIRVHSNNGYMVVYFHSSFHPYQYVSRRLKVYLYSVPFAQLHT